ncbi:MAG: transglutaminase family protein [Acidimicrobiia bacterium]|nr:MAG: transglutaminase family protein [Acidimicrobiia bacterium]
MDLSIRYVTRFVYSAPVWDSQNALRAAPASTPRQEPRSYALRVEPEASVFTYEDVWGTRVDTFGVVAAHDELVVEVEAEVTTQGPRDVATVQVEALSDPSYRDAAFGFLQRTKHTAFGSDIAAIAREVASGFDEVSALVDGVSKTVHDAIEYSPGATRIGVDVGEVWRTKAGVCQDYAHVMIAMLRSLGVGARYVSGYFYASDPTLETTVEGNEIVVATHAWVEAAIPGWGWLGLDPTNAAPVGERHVKIGHGRDYDDVTPLRGVYYGEAEHGLAAEVTMSTETITRKVLPEVHRAEQQALVSQQ